MNRKPRPTRRGLRAIATKEALASLDSVPQWLDVPKALRERIAMLLRAATTKISAIAPPAAFEAAARYLDDDQEYFERLCALKLALPKCPCAATATKGDAGSEYRCDNCFNALPSMHLRNAPPPWREQLGDLDWADAVRNLKTTKKRG